MRKINVISFVLLILGLIMVSCLDDYESFDVYEQFQTDKAIIKSYMTDNSIEAYEIDSSGVYISLFHQGLEDTLLHPTQSTMTVGYKGYLVDGSVFDETSVGELYSAELSDMIVGWRIAIPEMTKGDSATLLIPSYYGYGNIALGNIPASSVLIFDVFLDSFE